MTEGDTGDDRLSKSDRREVARRKAQALRAEQKKKDRRRRVLLQGGIAVGVLAIIAVVALIISNTYLKPPTAGPLNMASDGITIGQGLKAKTTGAVQPGDEPASSASSNPKVINIRLYIDYQCPLCKKFEMVNEKQLITWLKTGAATLEIHPLAILDAASGGAKYSTRSANAAACVANYSPDSFFAFNGLLFQKQPAEQSSGLTDLQLISMTTDAKVKRPVSIKNCILNQSFKTWVNASTVRALSGPIPGSKLDKVSQTPTVLVDGVKFPGDLDSANDFALFVNTAAGNIFTEESTATPTPTPSASATPAP
ncbi:MAG: thioredoxin domain-containing protein [Lacisediminihabitans sp.]